MNTKNKFQQYLPDYKDAYSKYVSWLLYESQHYIFHYIQNTLAETDIDSISKRQEKGYKKITTTLNIHGANKKIAYYLYPNKQTKKELMGDDGYAQSIYHDFSIHVVYTKNINPLGEHEDTHLITLPWGLSIGFLQEGLAEFMAGDRTWNNKPDTYWINNGFEKNIIPNINTLMIHQTWMDSPDKDAPYYYVYAGSFVRFLFEQFGKNLFEKLYKETNRSYTKKENIKIFEGIYKTSITEIEKSGKAKYVPLLRHFTFSQQETPGSFHTNNKTPSNT